MPPTFAHPACPPLLDVELVRRFHAGDDDALAVLIDRYRLLVWARARSYFLVGGDFDDLTQEGFIGLFKAARDFRPERHASFRAFAEVCITRQMITAIKAATRYKHGPLNSSVPMPREGADPRDSEAGALVDRSRASDPVEVVLYKEEADALGATVALTLSRLEVDVLALYIEGHTYEEIGRHLGRHAKSIDNALQRIKRKLEGQLHEPSRPAALAVA